MDWAALLNAVDTLGTLGLALVLAYLLLARKVVPYADLAELEAQHQQKADEQDKEHARELAYVEARRVEEREGRIAAEKRVTAFTASFDEVLAVMRGIKEEVIRGGRT